MAQACGGKLTIDRWAAPRSRKPVAGGRPTARRIERSAVSPTRTGSDSAVVVLESKLHPPIARQGWVHRSSLIARLVDAPDKKLVLLSTPVGYGKTILLAQWRAAVREPRPFAWLTLDDGDDDPITLWTYIIEALARVEPALRDRMAGAITSDPEHLNEVVVPRLLSELAVLPRRLVLVLDDYQRIRNESCHNSIDVFVDGLPQTTQLVLATRADPHLRLRETGSPAAVLELRASQLRFDRDEVEQLLKNTIDYEVSTQDVDRLIQRTEGWPAGLYLAALSLRDHNDPQRFIDSFAGDNHLLVDYLTMEVLRKQPPVLRRFLTRTSILDRLTPSACDAVVGTDNSSAVLEELEKSNLFLVSVDDGARWYRYHRLFQDLLRTELLRSEPDLLPELHRRASAWHRRWGFLEEALSHAIAAWDVPTVRELIGASWLPYWEAGRLGQVVSWLDDVGADRVGGDAVLALVRAWVAARSGDFDSSERWLRLVEKASFDGRLPDGTASLESGRSLLRALLGRTDPAKSLASARRAASLEESGSRWRARTLACLGYYLYLAGKPSEAAARLNEVVETTPTATDDQMFALGLLSLIARESSHMAEADELATRASHPITASSLLAEGALTTAHLAGGLARADNGDLAGSERDLEMAVSAARSSPWLQPWLLVQSLLAQAELSVRRGDLERSQHVLAEVREHLDRFPQSSVLSERARNLETSISRDHPLLGEPLTERELTVLRLMPTDSTQGEIGEQLYLSINTVKSHARSIFRKLGVGSRPEAVARAQDMGLI